jgi:uncharacterized linocin/CFP29 family protein
VLAVVELRAEFELVRDELRDAARGAPDPDLAPLDEAARKVAIAENTAVFHGWGDAIVGITQATPHAPIPLGEYPRSVAGAVEQLLYSGIGGPYALALGGDQYQLVVGTAESGGYPLLDHLRKILDGPIVWAPGLKSAIVLSLRGGDFLFDSGQDLAIGYLSHDAAVVRCYLEESFSFRVATPEAAVVLAT